MLRLRSPSGRQAAHIVALQNRSPGLVDRWDRRAPRSSAFFPSCIEEDIPDDRGAKVDYGRRRSQFMSEIGGVVYIWDRRERAEGRRFALPFDAVASLQHRQLIIIAPM
ncbi:hypothetical protein FIBSPDRAFT_539324 [Athelia psychrophila]|uniref:Uncharacterized protein n=1 Tax=Athelia psychrophila TaxID=1759441 RepID=A0A166J328_9AGAM|nr:hypothetical protein FIBSPDRAFT_539324 [Fibularhizoctonia sp. CBS 109695]